MLEGTDRIVNNWEISKPLSRSKMAFIVEVLVNFSREIN